jgi:hypothetical protein
VKSEKPPILFLFWYNVFNSALVGNRQPFPKERHALLASSHISPIGKSFSATNKLPILIGFPIISFASCAKQRQEISSRGMNNKFFIESNN